MAIEGKINIKKVLTNMLTFIYAELVIHLIKKM